VNSKTLKTNKNLPSPLVGRRYQSQECEKKSCMGLREGWDYKEKVNTEAGSEG
jgi:hypothetical protein